KSVTINGPGALAFSVSGNDAVRIFTMNTAGIDVTISGLTLTHGHDPTAGSGGAGGAIASFKTANLTVNNSILTGNHSGDDGGGIHMDGAGSHLTVMSTAITGNTAHNWGGAIYFYADNGVVNIAGSDLSGNTATQGGGATWMGGEHSSSITITNTTV